MSRPGHNHFFLPFETADHLTTQRFGKLHPSVTNTSDNAEWVVLDDFDRSICKSGGLLLERGDQIELLTATGDILVQRGRLKNRFVADLAAGAVKEALSGRSPPRALMNLGSIKVQKAMMTLRDDKGKTRAQARILLLASDSSGAGMLVTLQGLRGHDRALAKLRGKIARLGGVPPKRAEMIKALFPDHPAYEPKPEITIDRDEAAFDVATHIIAAYLPVARINEAGVIDDLDTEFLHDYRIALRKIRSVLSLFKGVYDEDQTTGLKSRFSALMAMTGTQRDLDVYLLEKQKYYDLLPRSLHGGLDKMFDVFLGLRNDEQLRLARHLKGKAYRREITQLTKLLAKPEKLRRGPKAGWSARNYASALIWKRYRKICRIAPGIGPHTDDAEVHALRIQCKKLRYLMEFFAPVIPAKQVKHLIRPLKKLQDNLGYFNDYSVQQKSLERFLRDLDVKPRTKQQEIAQSVGALIAILHRRQLAERAKVVESFARFNSLETQQTFRALFHAGKDQK